MVAAKPSEGAPPTPSRSNWNLLFLGFMLLAATACVLAVLTGISVVPSLHTPQEMHPHRHHPSFDAPGLLRIHNRDHKADFEKAYRRPVVIPKAAAAAAATKDVAMTSDSTLDGNEAAANKANNANSANANAKFETMDGTQNPNQYHMVFSTSCSPFQNWQSLAFFYFAHKVRQPGTVTRLVSGCSDQQKQDLQTVHARRVVPLQIPGLQTFHLHFTPDFDPSNGGDNKYFNKPNGLLHWMEEFLGFETGSDHEKDDSFIIIVDPDMMLLRPITEDVTSKNYNGGWVNTGNAQKHQSNGDNIVDYEHDIVSHGRPHAQKYGYGAGWLTAVEDHLEEIVGKGSPALKVNRADAQDYYPAGPPYIATAKDMYQIAIHWVKFLPKYHEYFKGMMCEMHSYSLAAAHLELPHKLAERFMVSDVDSAENFEFIEQNMDKGNVCMRPPKLVQADPTIPFDAKDSRTMTDPAYEVDRNIPIRELPFVLHYCQRYALGRFFFSKYKLAEDMFDVCESPLMVEPPKTVAQIYDWNMFPNGKEFHDFAPDPKATDQWKEDLKRKRHLRHGWMLCAVVMGVNEAVQEMKKALCGNDPRYFLKTWHFHDEKNFTDSILDPSNPWKPKPQHLNINGGRWGNNDDGEGDNGGNNDDGEGDDGGNNDNGEGDDGGDGNDGQGDDGSGGNDGAP